MANPAGQKILRDVFLGFMRMHILHHAAKDSIYGLDMIEELRRHGYRIGPGTLYPMLHSLEEAGLLNSKWTLVAGKNRRYYVTTKAGDAVLHSLRGQLREVVDEIVIDETEYKGTSAKPAR
jgi:PadR family transcriptional regulator, regulatory protein PadR